MLRRIVRFYFRLRYFPRLLIERLNAISSAVAGLHRYEADLIARLMAAHEERLARVHEEIAAFCDDATHAMMTVSASIADVDTRLQALQLGLQRLDNGTVEAQGRMAALQQSVQHLHEQAAHIARIEAMLREQARLLPGHAPDATASAAAFTTPNGPGEAVGDDGRLNHA
jgi:chromosome segregation ATPase